MARVVPESGPSDVFVPKTTKGLVVGSGLSFGGAGEHELKRADRWLVYRLVD